MARSSTSSGRKPRPTVDPAHLKQLIGRPLPNAREAEVPLLGSMILDPRVIGDVLQIIRGPEDFSVPAHAAIYETLIEMYEKAVPIDGGVDLHQRLQDKRQLDAVGGTDYIIELSEAVANPGGAAHYARLVRDKAIHRGLLESLNRCYFEAHESSLPVGDLLDTIEREIFEVAHQRNESSGISATAAEMMQEAMELLEREDGVSTGIATGFYDLDELLGGLQPGDMIVLAARPSMGKTALALSMAQHIAVVGLQPTAVFSLEMSRQQIAWRLLSGVSGVSSHRIRRNVLGSEEMARLTHASADIGEAPLHVDDSTDTTIMRLRAKARRLAARHDIKVIFIDYLQLMSAPGSESRQQEVSTISRGIKALARELNVPVVCLSQLNRQSEGREGHRPRMSDLRDSGSIEQDADVVMLLHREEYYHRDDPRWADENPEKAGMAELIVAKQRNGPVGTVRLQFSADDVRFANLACDHQASMY